MDIRHRVYRAIQSLFMEDAYIARVYYESMRDNFEGYDVVNDIKGFIRLRRDFRALAPAPNKEPTLGELFRIELALLRHLPDSAVESRFWSIDDRFRRTVPQSVIDSYDRRTPALGDGKWSSIEFVRSQSRTLLDVIHANYLINLGREQSTKRLMFIIAIASLLILALAGVLAATAPGNLARQGLVLIAVAGMFGAIISIVNRLQKATSRDAMAQDGIFELIGLRTGWVSILMSITIGGVFALVLYAMVMGGVVDLFVPELQPLKTVAEAASESGDGKANPNAVANANAVKSAEGKPGAAGGESKPETGKDLAQTAGNAAPQNPPIDLKKPGVSSAGTGTASGSATSGKAVGSGNAAANGKGKSDEPNLPVAPKCPEAGAVCRGWVDRVATTLHFGSRLELFKMIVLAFVAGFAERFVPDILNRLSKEHK